MKNATKANGARRASPRITREPDGETRSINLEASATEILTEAAALYQSVRSLESCMTLSQLADEEVRRILDEAKTHFAEIVVECGQLDRFADDAKVTS